MAWFATKKIPSMVETERETKNKRDIETVSSKYWEDIKEREAIRGKIKNGRRGERGKLEEIYLLSKVINVEKRQR